MEYNNHKNAVQRYIEAPKHPTEANNNLHEETNERIAHHTGLAQGYKVQEEEHTNKGSDINDDFLNAANERYD